MLHYMNFYATHVIKVNGQMSVKEGGEVPHNITERDLYLCQTTTLDDTLYSRQVHLEEYCSGPFYLVILEF